MAVVVLSVGMLMAGTWCQEEITAVYIVTLRRAPAAHYFSDELNKDGNLFHKRSSSGKLTIVHKPRYCSFLAFFVRELILLCATEFTL